MMNNDFLDNPKDSFQLSEAALTEYPCLADPDLSDEQKRLVNSVIANNRLIQDAIPKIKTGKPTIGVEFVAEMVRLTLEEVKVFADKFPRGLTRLIDKESRLRSRLLQAARQAIGQKARQLTGIYS